LKEIITLINKELKLEWRQKYAVNGMLLYLISTVYVCYQGFKAKSGSIEPITWNTLYWIILLFTGVNSIARSFMQERAGRLLYIYTLASPKGIILSKIIYNSLLMLVLGSIGFLFYAFVMGNPVQDMLYFYVSIVLGCFGFATTLTLVAGIASKADNNSTLMAILSFPIILPTLLIVMKLSKNAMDGLDRGSSSNEIILLLALDLMVVALSYILFPFLWRS
jgi:heme exporter protein B